MATFLALAAGSLVAGCVEGPPTEPPGFVRAEGFAGKTDDGRTVRLLAVGRTKGMMRLASTPVSRWPVWDPSGKKVRDVSELPRVSLPMGIPVEDDVRALAFTVLGSGGHEDAIGYVPDGRVRKGEDGLDPNSIGSWPFAVFAWGILPKSSRFRLGLAYGEWRSVASRRIDLARRIDETVLQGPWGRVRHRMPSAQPLDTFKNILSEASWGDYALEPAHFPPADELRLRIVDDTGREGQPYLVEPPSRRPSGFATVEVQARRWHWIEFAGIHYDPNRPLGSEGGEDAERGHPGSREKIGR